MSLQVKYKLFNKEEVTQASLKCLKGPPFGLACQRWRNRKRVRDKGVKLRTGVRLKMVCKWGGGEAEKLRAITFHLTASVIQN